MIDIEKFRQINIDIVKILNPDADYLPECDSFPYDGKLLAGKYEKDNYSLIKNVLEEENDKPALLVAPCSAGKTYTIARIFSKMAYDSDTYCILAVPFRNMALQNQYEYDIYGFQAIVGGGKNPSKYLRRFSVVYDKMEDMLLYCKKILSSNHNAKFYLVIDEAQYLTTALGYRPCVKILKDITDCGLFRKVLCMTATPAAIANMQFSRIIHFSNVADEKLVKKLTIIQAEHLREAIYDFALNEESPYVRVNDFSEIDTFRKKLEEQGKKVVTLTSRDKETYKASTYGTEKYKNSNLQSIVEEGNLKNDKMVLLCTSSLDAGVNFTKYSPQTKALFAVMKYYHICADDIEQFFSRFRSGLEEAVVIQPVPAVKKGKKKPAFKSLQDKLKETIQIAESRIIAVKKTYDVFKDEKDENVLKKMKDLLSISHEEGTSVIDDYFDIIGMDEELEVEINYPLLYYFAYQRFNEQYYHYPKKLADALAESFGMDITVIYDDREFKGIEKAVHVPKISWDDLVDDGIFESLLDAPSFVNSIRIKSFSSLLPYFDEDTSDTLADDSVRLCILENNIKKMMGLNLNAQQCVTLLSLFTNERDFDKAFKRLLQAYHYECFDTYAGSPSDYSEDDAVYSAVKKVKGKRKSLAFNNVNIKAVQDAIPEKNGKKMSKAKIKHRIEKIFFIEKRAGRSSVILDVKKVGQLYKEIIGSFHCLSLPAADDGKEELPSAS